MLAGRSRAPDTTAAQAPAGGEGSDGDLKLLPFQQDIVEELLHSDGLTIMGKGLGLCTVAAALLMVHHATPDSGGVVIILGAASERWLMLCM